MVDFFKDILGEGADQLLHSFGMGHLIVRCSPTHECIRAGALFEKHAIHESIRKGTGIN